ncbi:MAG: signal peptide peptidase SppA [Mariprofundaceae bacterium]|nr:signal peptide peptidase SppA [Mariprofundaceae bacterium]
MKRLFSGSLRILDGFRRLLINLVFAVFLILILVAIFKVEPKLPDEAVLLIKPQGQLVEQIKQPSADAFPLAFPDPNQSKLRNLSKALEIARDDKHILAVKLDLQALQHSSLAKLQVLRAAIEDFKQSGKPVLVSGNAYSQSQYYLAAAASSVFLHPMGSIEINGFSVYRNYIRSALDKLNIDVHVFRVGEYKSAVEPFIRDSMSDADRKSNSVWLNSLWHAYKQDIAAMRDIDATHFQNLLDHQPDFLAQHKGNAGALYKAEHLIDYLGDESDAEAFLLKQLKWTKKEDIPSISSKDYLKLASKTETKPADTPKVGLIIASGPILNGEQPSGSIGSKTLVKLLRKAQKDEQIKVIVLRIDSPGGSALASEVIRKEVARLRAAGKPVVVSMGSVAASGGYWIASAADEIWAQPTTLTGSIGVFGIIPNFTRGLNHLGIHTDGVGTTEMASAMRPDMPLSENMGTMIQMGVDHIYQRFIHLVATGRHMKVTDVEAIAQGRVWSGVDAHRLGLVDQLGGLQDAIKSAAKRGGIADNYQLEEVKTPLSFPEMIAEQLLGDADALVQLQATWMGNDSYAALLQNTVLQSILQPLHLLTQFNDPNHIYAYSELAD